MLNPGRNCEVDSQCYTGLCDEAEGKCLGKAAGASCGDSRECGVGLTCMHGDAFPFETTCQAIGTYGDPCEEDADCPFDAICWYDAAGLTHFDTRCVRKLSLATGT